MSTDRVIIYCAGDAVSTGRLSAVMIHYVGGAVSTDRLSAVIHCTGGAMSTGRLTDHSCTALSPRTDSLSSLSLLYSGEPVSVSLF